MNDYLLIDNQFNQCIINCIPSLYFILSGLTRQQRIRNCAISNFSKSTIFQTVYQKQRYSLQLGFFHMIEFIIIGMVLILSQQQYSQVFLNKFKSYMLVPDLFISISWFFSQTLLIQEQNRQIPQSWYCHRIFWIFRFIIVLQFIILIIIELISYNNIIALSILLLFKLLELTINFKLAFQAIFKYDDTTLLKFKTLASAVTIKDSQAVTVIDYNNKIDSHHSLTSLISCDNSIEFVLPIIKIKIPRYKHSLTNSRSVTNYKIFVQIYKKNKIDCSYKLKKRFSEFQKLDKKLKNQYNYDIFPDIQNTLPRLKKEESIFKVDSSFLDKRKESLEQYLKSLLKISTDLKTSMKQQPYLCEDLIRFLEIEDKYAQELMMKNIWRNNNPQIESNIIEENIFKKISDKQNWTILLEENNAKDYQIINQNQINEKNIYYQNENIPVNNELQFGIMIKEHITGENFINQIVEIEFSQCKKYAIAKRFNDFQVLYDYIKNISNIKLPKFPEKTPKLYTLNDDEINCRKLLLENWLFQILNDPTQHIDMVFNFINIHIDANETLEVFLLREHMLKQILNNNIDQLKYFTLCRQNVVINSWEGKYGNNRSQISYKCSVIKETQNKEQYNNQKIDEYYIYKRYNDFKKLNNWIKGVFKNDNNIYSRLPVLPSEYLGLSLNLNQVESRRHDLEEYLKKLFDIKNIIKTSYFQQFLLDPIIIKQRNYFNLNSSKRTNEFLSQNQTYKNPDSLITKDFSMKY